MALRGVSAADAGDAIRATFAGQPAGVVALPDRTVDVAVTVPEDQRRDPEALGQTLVRTASGGAVRLADIATISLGTERLSIAHEGGQRRQVVTANVTDGDVSGFVAAAKARIARNVHLPPACSCPGPGRRKGRPRRRGNWAAMSCSPPWRW
jgi:Cu/Ag efflux pump CusA